MCCNHAYSSHVFPCLQIDGVHDVHDLHVWNLSLGLPILSAHVNVAADAQTDLVSFEDKCSQK